VAVSSFVVPGERRHTSSTRDWGSDVCSSDLVLRRVRPESDDDETLRVSDLELDPATYQVTRAGRPVELAPTEYKMLRYLMINARSEERRVGGGVGAAGGRAQTRHSWVTARRT